MNEREREGVEDWKGIVSGEKSGERVVGGFFVEMGIGLYCEDLGFGLYFGSGGDYDNVSYLIYCTRVARVSCA